MCTLGSFGRQQRRACHLQMDAAHSTSSGHRRAASHRLAAARLMPLKELQYFSFHSSQAYVSLALLSFVFGLSISGWQINGLWGVL